MRNLRSFVDAMPFEESLVTIIQIKQNGMILFAKNKTDKRAMVVENGDRLLAAWTGEWSTDIFEFPAEKLLEV